MSNKRNYTKRGTTVIGKRVVLLDGVPVGRGRPSKNGKGERTVVYIPVNEEYDVAKHGTGVMFRGGKHSAFKRLKVDNTVVDLNKVGVNEQVDVYEVNSHSELEQVIGGIKV